MKPIFSTTQHRLAAHYLNRLRAANARLVTGHVSSAQYGLKLLDLDWVGYMRAVCYGLYSLGAAHLRLNQYAEATARLQEAAELARQHHYPIVLQDVLDELTQLYLTLGEPKTAEPFLYESILLARQMEAGPDKTRCVANAVMLWKIKGFAEHAAGWAGVVADSSFLDHSSWFATLADLEMTLGSEGFQQALARGKLMALDESLGEILKLLDPAHAPETRPEQMSE
jgi:hypothetical protein